MINGLLSSDGKNVGMTKLPCFPCFGSVVRKLRANGESVTFSLIIYFLFFS